MTVVNLDSNVPNRVKKNSLQGEKEFPSGYTVRDESEPYILKNPDEDSVHFP